MGEPRGVPTALLTVSDLRLIGSSLGRCGVPSSLGLQRVGSQRQIRAQNYLALETSGFETAVCLGDLLEADPLGDSRPNGAGCQKAEEPLQVLPEPGGMSCPHGVD